MKTAHSTDIRRDLVIIEEFFLAVPCQHQEEPEILATTVHVDLAEFQLTKQELEKLQGILKKMNYALSDAFSEVCSAASVMTDVFIKKP